MDLLHEIAKLLSSPLWSGVGVLTSSILSIITLLLARKSPSKPGPPQQESEVPESSPLAFSLPDQGILSSSLTATPYPKRQRNNHQRSRQWMIPTTRLVVYLMRSSLPVIGMISCIRLLSTNGPEYNAKALCPGEPRSYSVVSPSRSSSSSSLSSSRSTSILLAALSIRS